MQLRIENYQRYLSERDPEYLNWAIDRLVNWNRCIPIPGIIHIHGAQDSVFPLKTFKIHLSKYWEIMQLFLPKVIGLM